MLRKSISLILAMMIVISVFTVIPMTASAEDVLDNGDYQYVVSDDHAEIVKYLKDEKKRDDPVSARRQGRHEDPRERIQS